MVRPAARPIAIATLVVVICLGATAAAQIVSRGVVEGGQTLGARGSTPVATPTTIAPCSSVIGVGSAGDACVAVVNTLAGPVALGPGASSGLTGGDIPAGAFVDFAAVPGGDLDPGDLPTTGATDLTLAGGRAYVLVIGQAYDQLGPSVALAPIDLSRLPEGQSRLAFHHAVTDAADLGFVPDGLPEGSALLPGETTEGIAVASGSVRFDVLPALDRSILLATLTADLEPGISYLVIVGGTTADGSLRVVYAAAPVAT